MLLIYSKVSNYGKFIFINKLLGLIYLKIYFWDKKYWYYFIFKYYLQNIHFVIA